ncbi:MAG: hypothetical protein PWQ45_1517, partial [Thermosipho sp. (in: thermotogales)]|nr:hypothetical protein [Thermosipho sp. (in: thermotogales)]
MKKSIILLLFISLISLFTFAESRELIIQNTQKTDVKVPQVFTFAQLLDKFGDDFDANWESLRVKDSSGTSIVYQITDLDGNGRISSDDQITFAFKNYAKIIVTDDFDTEALYFKPNFTVTKNDDSYTIENSD